MNFFYVYFTAKHFIQVPLERQISYCLTIQYVF